MSDFSLGTMGQLVACGPVEGQGKCWLAQGGQVPDSIFILSRPAHASEAVALIPQPSRAMSPGNFSSLGFLSSLVTRAVGTLTTHPQFRATLTKPQPPRLHPSPGTKAAFPFWRDWRWDRGTKGTATSLQS